LTDSTCYAVTLPDTGATDPLHELLRKGARDLIAKAVEAELNTLPLAVRQQEAARWPLQSAQKRWKRIKGFSKLELVVNNVKFQDGEPLTDQSDRDAA